MRERCPVESQARVLIVGGQADAPSTAGIEIFDPSTGQLTAGGNLQVARSFHSAISLVDGRVLIVGGGAEDGSQPFFQGIEATEIFDPTTGTVTAGPTLHPAFFASTATLLANAKVLIFDNETIDGFPVPTATLFE